LIFAFIYHGLIYHHKYAGLTKVTDHMPNTIFSEPLPPIFGARTERNIPTRFSSLYFPSDYRRIDHYITFTALKFQSVTRTSALASDQPLAANRRQVAQRTQASITLPMPNELQTSYNANYPSKELSNAGEVLAAAASNVDVDKILSAATGGTGTIANILRGARELTQQLGGAVSAGALGTALGADAVSRAPDAFQAGLANVAGIARNPNNVLLFGGVDFRSHTFSFSLTPRNKREADTIQRIITTFKKHMLPRYGLGRAVSQRGEQILTGLISSSEFLSGINIPNSQNIAAAGATSRAFFEYPDVFMIRFRNEKKLFTIGESVLESFSVNYHPQNYPAYVRSLSSPGEANPAAITITMSFKETDIVTREQVEQFGR